MPSSASSSTNRATQPGAATAMATMRSCWRVRRRGVLTGRIVLRALTRGAITRLLTPTPRATPWAVLPGGGGVAHDAGVDPDGVSLIVDAVAGGAAAGAKATATTAVKDAYAGLKA